MKKLIYFLGFTVCSIVTHAQSKDTVLTFSMAKARLMKANLSLLASYYDINIANAVVIQARVWNNPYFVFNGDLYSNEANEYFHFRNQHLLQSAWYRAVHGSQVQIANRHPVQMLPRRRICVRVY